MDLFYRARYYDSQLGRFLTEDPIAALGSGTNLYVYVSNSPISWTDALGLQKCKSCGLKVPPEYNVRGTIAGGSSFQWHAIFLNDGDHDPSCCEVRQLVSWDNGPPNHGGFQPPNRYKAGVWYQDRDDIGKRYGRRKGGFADLNPGFNWYSGNEYVGKDQPMIHHPDIFHFRLIVVDVCNGGKTIFTSRTINVTFK